MRRIKWYIKQLLPLRYEYRFRECSNPGLYIWHMWLGRCFNARLWELAE